MTVYRTYNAYALLTTVLVLVLSALACTMPAPTTAGGTVVKTPTTPPKSVVKPLTTVGKPDNTLTTVVVTAIQSLHVRVRPGEQEPLAEDGYLYNGNTVTLTNLCKNGWAEIVWKQSVAWVNSKYLSRNDCQKVTGD